MRIYSYPQLIRHGARVWFIVPVLLRYAPLHKYQPLKIAWYFLFIVLRLLYNLIAKYVITYKYHSYLQGHMKFLVVRSPIPFQHTMVLLFNFV